MFLAACIVLTVCIPGAQALAFAAGTVEILVNDGTGEVTIRGNIASGAGKQVTITVINPSGGYDYIDQATSGENGSFQFSYTLDETSGGVYKVSIGGSSLAEDINATFVYSPSTGGSPPPTPGTPSTPPAASPATAIPPDFAGAMESLDKAIDDIAGTLNPSTAYQKAIDVILSASKAVKNSKGEEINQLTRELVRLTQTALQKVSAIRYGAQLSGTGSSTVISPLEVSRLAEKMDEVINKTSRLRSALAEAGINVMLQSEIRIDTTVEADCSRADVTLPGALFRVAREKGIDGITVASSVAAITIPPDAFSTDIEGNLSLSAALVNREDLPEDLREIAGDNPVYDFNLSAGGENISSFQKPLTITIPYTLKEGEDPEKITVFYIDSSGKLVNQIGRYDEKTGTISFTVRHFSKYVIKLNDVSFKDLGKAQWAKQAIETMASKGVIKGNGKGYFNPLDDVTRSQFTAMVVRALGLVDASAANDFNDVDSGHILYTEISSAYEAGLLEGLSTENSFNPDAFITRQDMAVIIANALVKFKGKKAVEDPSEYLANFTDGDEIDSYAAASVATAAKYALVIGGPSGSFNPKGFTTRASAATVIHRLFNII